MARGLAPHVDPVWAEDFAIQLRLLGVEGGRIGDALSEVESHCEESEESATEAFGDPVDYARNLQLPQHTDTSSRAMLLSVLPTIFQVLGMFMLIWSFEAWLSHQQLEITVAHSVTAAAFLTGTLLLVRFADQVLPALARRPGLLGIILVAWIAVLALSFRILDDVIWRVGPGWSLTAGAAALIGGVAWVLARHSTHGSSDGPILSPLDNAPTSSRRRMLGSRRRMFEPFQLGSLIGMAQIPVATAILLATTLMLHNMSTR
jgi:hypothetical protein